MNFFTRAFSEAGGQPSSTRVFSAVVCAVTLFNWTWANLHGTKMAELSWEAVGLVSVAMGVKAWQRGKENGNGDTKFLTKNETTH